MDINKTAIERAFDLARSGTYLKIHDIIRKLKHEGYVNDQILGPTLKKQLLALIEHAKKPDA
jgi:hypothetical protein